MTEQELYDALSARCEFQGNIGYFNEWIDLLIELHEKLVELDPDYTIFQVKNKFGGLRFYFTPSENCSNANADKMCKLVDDAEARSFDLVK